MNKNRAAVKRAAARKPQAGRPRIAIVGANFAGLTAAQHFGREYDVTVIDQSPWFEWLPSLHELISGVKRPDDLRLPRARLVARAGHKFLRADVTAIDARKGNLTTAAGGKVAFDICIVAVGGIGETYGVKGVERHAHSLGDVAECEAIRRKLAQLAKLRGQRSAVIVGGGLEGIEALGEVLRRYRNVPGLQIELIEAGPNLLGGSPPSIEKAVRKHCVDNNVLVHMRSPVSVVSAKGIRLRSGARVRSDLTIWTGGMTAPPLLLQSGLATRPRQWAPVEPTLQSKYFANVFVAGDAAGTNSTVAKQAYFAMQMGECAAANARRSLAGRALRSFKPSPKPMLIAFGDLDTFFVSGRRVVASPGLAALKEAVYQYTMAEFDPPVSIAAVRETATRLTGAARKLGISRRDSLSIGAGARRAPARRRTA